MAAEHLPHSAAPLTARPDLLTHSIRPYRAADAFELARIFRASVRSVPPGDYTASQILAWASALAEEAKFAARCARRSTWVAEADDRIAGFSDLESDGHIDMLYVHPRFQRRGVARALLEHLECVARSLRLSRLYAEASVTARPVFERLGFRVVTPQIVVVGGESMTNYRMEKILEPLEPRRLAG
jgi:putative acetyltransferase